MQLFDHADIDARLWAGLIEEFRANFAAARAVAPARQVLEIDLPNGKGVPSDYACLRGW
ncbi:hypothetical protein ABID26_007340 [Mesorhizobium shonense]|uniref:Uncharacterized protein n=1 Tax=Mesorhizobium shonense TaxID=1209948 RepID=A0ABV2I4Y2_9HYPH